ncbi:glycosyltransferase [Tropicimonas sp. TH_r6]|uniref:glycosyltransferase family 2 protein n=1 Tax=Tropicimonas sp. TH_r6 TaxID=3082085 RepID=UPI002953F427|nr:glycosyltransferase [Tropicimonas sp. TH_r6]MDV7142728.1 glycosyltransferase [Tropicimonas sp. TH_r6]
MGDRIVVATVTRNRPVMLGRLLDSLARITPPEDTELDFIVVENAETLSLAPPAATLPGPLHLLNEPELGIPFARNRALDSALEMGADWLVFVDDDETVRPDWLAELHAGAVRAGADLAAGPVVPVAPDGALTRSEQAMMDYYTRMAEERQTRMAAQMAPRDLPTNNWICRLAAAREVGLRFDEALRMTGGSDTRLSRQAVEAGLRTGWIAAAVVEEEMPRARLTAGYLFRRAKSQTLAKIEFEYRAKGKPILGKALFHILAKGGGGALRWLAGLVTGSDTRLRGVRSLGVAAGWAQAALGGRSRLYDRVIGS